jgi:putative oxidoreductase
MASGGGGGASDIGLLFLRLAGVGLATHGYAKIFGGGVSGTVDAAEAMGFPLPVVFGWAAAASELLGGALVAIGLFTRPAAVFAAITMFVAAFLHHAEDPFARRELALAYLVILLAIACMGAGRWSVDAIARKGS